jgi:hypothetical protein
MNDVFLFWSREICFGVVMLFHFVLTTNLSLFFKSVLLLYFSPPKQYYCLFH